MNTEKNFREVKHVFQRSDGLWPVRNNLLTSDEFEKLMEISDCNWIVIVYPNKVRAYPTTDCLNLEGLKEDTLRKIADEKELNSDNVADIIANIQWKKLK